jgi:transposase InsO family protein
MKLAEEYGVSVVCRVLELPRSSYYYEGPPETEDERALVAAVERLAGEWPTYGYRRLSAQLEREGYEVNSKRVRRVMAELGITRHPKPRRVRTTNSQHGFGRFANLVEDLVVERPDQVWVADVTYIRLQREFVYLAVLMDVFTRAIRGWHLGRSLEQELTLTALARALQAGCPEIHHSDQGVQYAATAYVRTLQEAGVAISMAEVGEPTQNGYAERLMRTIKEEHVDLSESVDYHDAYQQLGRFLDEVYMHKRIHSSLGYLTPAEFESQWCAQQQVDEVTHSNS